MWDTYRHTHNGILFSHKKERIPAIFNSMDGPWGHCAKWNKSDREIQILYDLTNMWTLKGGREQSKFSSACQRKALMQPNNYVQLVWLTLHSIRLVTNMLEFLPINSYTIWLCLHVNIEWLNIIKLWIWYQATRQHMTGQAITYSCYVASAMHSIRSIHSEVVSVFPSHVSSTITWEPFFWKPMTANVRSGWASDCISFADLIK